MRLPLTILLATAVVTMTAGPAVTQTAGWYQDRTTSGCLFHLPFDPAGSQGWTSQWSESCTPGQAIEGRGSLEERGPSMGEADTVLMTRRTGQMIGGYWHGPVTEERFASRNGGPMEPESYSFDRFVPSITQTYDMGCRPGLSTCTPGVVTAAIPTSPDIESHDGPMGGAISSSNPPGFGMPMAFLHPDTGRPCVVLTEVEARDTSNERRRRIVHVLHFENICNDGFSYYARRIPLGEQIKDPDGVSGTGIGPAKSQTSKSQLICIEEGDRDTCQGFSEWWVQKGNQRTEPAPVQ